MKFPFHFAAAALVLSAGVAIGVGSTRQDTAPKADPYRAFDFWVGDWECFTTSGKLAGTNNITLGHGNKVLQEHWTDAGGGTGTSLNIYDKRTQRWHQTWVDASGTLLLLDGNLTDSGVMRMEGTMLGQGGKEALHRIEWTPEGKNVHQVWTSSLDEGKTWKTLADLTYKPRE